MTEIHTATFSSAWLLEKTTQRLAGLAARRSGFVLGLQGVAGIGKSYTAQRLLQNLPCRFGITQAATSIKQLFLALRGSRKLIGVIERNLQRVLLGEQVEFATQLDVFVAILVSQAPFVLLVEDMHEASPEQLEFWQGLTKVLPQLSGVAMLQTSRVAFNSTIESLALEALTPLQSEQLLEQHLQAKLPTEALTWIYSKCQGNPLFSLEFADFLIRHNALWSDGKTWKWREPKDKTLPNTVEAVIEQWLTDLAFSPETRVVLESKAYFETRVQGQNLEPQTWASICQLSLEDWQAAMQQLELHKVVEHGVFAHPLYREVTAQNMDTTLRQRLAWQAVQVFTAHDPRLILVFLEDACLGSDAALQLLEKQAVAAQSRQQTSTAGLFFAKAVGFAQGQQKGHLAFAAAKALQWSNSTKALELAELAVQVLQNNGEALVLVVELMFNQGRGTDLLPVLQRLPEATKRTSGWVESLVSFARTGDRTNLTTFISALPELEQTENISLLSMLIRVMLSIKNSDWAVRLAYRAEVLATQLLTPLEQIKVLDVQSWICDLQTNYTKKEALQSQVIEIAHEQHFWLIECQALYHRANARMELSQEKAALADYQQSVKIAEEIGHLSAFYTSQLELARLKILMADTDKVETILFAAKAYFDNVRPANNMFTCQGFVELYMFSNREHRKKLIQSYSKKAIEYWEISKLPIHEIQVQQVQANLALELSDPQSALDIAENLIQIAQLARGYTIKGLALAALQRPSEAIKALEIALQNTSQQRQMQLITLELANLTRDVKRAAQCLAWFTNHGLQAYVQLTQRYFPTLFESVPEKIIFAPKLEVLGSMRVCVADKAEIVRGQKRQKLLALLLQSRIQGETEVLLEDLRLALYPDQALADAFSALRQTISKTRASYGKQVIITTARGYSLGNLQTDAELFLSNGDTQLWRGAYLESVQLDGFDSVQENLHFALQTRASEILSTNPKEAARVLSILRESNPYNLEALRLLCTALRATRNHATLNRTYQKAIDTFAEIGERLPQTWMAFLETTQASSSPA